MDCKWQMERLKKLVRRDWENTDDDMKLSWDEAEKQFNKIELVNTDNPGTKFFRYHYDSDEPEKYTLIGFEVENGKTKYLAFSLEDEHYVDGEV